MVYGMVHEVSGAADLEMILEVARLSTALTYFGDSLARHMVGWLRYLSFSGIDPEDGAEHQVRRAIPPSRTVIQGIR